jgi:hypothetical protein
MNTNGRWEQIMYTVTILEPLKKEGMEDFFYKKIDFGKLQNINFVGYKNKHGKYVN